MLALHRDADSIKRDLSRILVRFPGQFDIDDIEERARDGRIQIFPTENSTVAGCVIDHGDTALLAAGAGRMDEIIALEPILCDFYFLRLGCRLMLLHGRKGWARVLRPLGWEIGVPSWHTREEENAVSKTLEAWADRVVIGLRS